MFELFNDTVSTASNNKEKNGYELRFERAM